MEQIEIISWKTLDAIKQAATHVYGIIGDLDTGEQMVVFCSVDDDFFELYYSELESNYIRRYDDEEDLEKNLESRRNELGEEEFDEVNYYDEENAYDDANTGDDYSGFKIRDEEDDDY